MARFTKVKAAEILGLVKGGAGVVRAAEMAGVSPRTVRRWCRDGERNPQGKYGKFSRDIQAAKAGLLANCEQTLFHSAIKERDSADAKWLLTKLAPDEYGDKHTIDVKVRGELQALFERIEPHLEHATTFPDLLRAIRIAEGLDVGRLDDAAGEPVH